MMRFDAVVFGLLVVVCGSLAQECGVCNTAACAPVTGANCVAGITKDKCNCCNVCSRGFGQSCDLPDMPNVHGPCGSNLKCNPTSDGLPACICEHNAVLCGTDGKTYYSLCELRAAKVSHEKKDIFVAAEGPCRSAPSIISAPRDIRVKRHGNVSIACEAAGFPIPFVAWLFTNANDETESLPGNNMNNVVVSRGGPSAFQVTGWIQIQEITDKQEGDYTCVVQNKEGSTTATARIIVLQNDFEG